MVSKKVVALALWLVFGWTGAHRFYLGLPRSGILYLCTFGLFGLGWFSDAFLIKDLLREQHKKDHKKEIYGSSTAPPPPQIVPSTTTSALPPPAPREDEQKPEEKKKEISGGRGGRRKKADRREVHKKQAHSRAPPSVAAESMSMSMVQTNAMPMDSISLSILEPPATQPPQQSMQIPGSSAVPAPPPPPPSRAFSVAKPKSQTSQLPPPKTHSTQMLSAISSARSLPKREPQSAEEEKEKEKEKAQDDDRSESISEEEEEKEEEKAEEREKGVIEQSDASLPSVELSDQLQQQNVQASTSPSESALGAPSIEMADLDDKKFALPNKKSKEKKKKKKSKFLQFDLDNMFRSLAMWMPWMKIKWLFVIILFLLLVASSLWLVLPAFFLLLLLSTTHIEETSEQMIGRHEVLKTESTQKRGFRWLRLFLCSSPITFIFIGFPAIIVWELPKHGEHAYWAGVVAQTSVVVLFVILGMIRNLARIRLREKLKLAPTSEVPKPIGKTNFRNWIVFIALLYESVQMAVYPFMKDDQSSSSSFSSSSSVISSGQNTIAGIVIPAIFFTLKNIGVWLLAAVMGPALTGALILLFCGEVTSDLVKYRKSLLTNESKEGHDTFFKSFTGSVAFGHGYLKDVSPFVSSMFDLISNTLFMTAGSQLISSFSCAFEEYCYAVHPVSTYISLVSFSFLAPLAILTGPMLMEGSQRKKDMRWNEAFLMLMCLAKMILLLVTSFSNDYAVRVYCALIIAIALFTVTYVWSQKVEYMNRPCAAPLGNIWRCMTYLVFFIAAIWCIITLHYPILSDTSLGVAIAVCILLVVGIVPCSIVQVSTAKALKYKA